MEFHWREFNPRGCSIVLLAFAVNLLYSFILKCMGVLLPTLTEQFTTDTWVIGVMVEIMATAGDVTGNLVACYSAICVLLDRCNYGHVAAFKCYDDSASPLK